MTDLTEAAAIVAALAGREPVDAEGGYCVLCGELPIWGHAQSCPWLRARQWAETMTGED